MGKTFDELFNEFFKKNNINPQDKITDDVKGNVIRILDLLSKHTVGEEPTDTDKIMNEKEKEFDDKLGKPDKTEFFNNGSVFFERRIWYTPEGEIQKLIFSQDPSLIVPEKPLQEQLDEAVLAEDFEKAAAIRDRMKKLKAKPRKKKNEKKD